MNRSGPLSGKTKLVTVNVTQRGIRLEDLLDCLRAYEDRNGHPRVRANADGDLCVFVDNYTV